jgi:hypothetical protein
MWHMFGKNTVIFLKFIFASETKGLALVFGAAEASEIAEASEARRACAGCGTAADARCS